MKSIVTGASGQVGTYLVSLLAEGGHAVTAFDRTESIVPASVCVQTGDICDSASLDALLEGECDVIFHLAGLNALHPAQEIHHVNVEGTIALLAAVERRNRPVRVIVMSSSAVYGPSQDDPILENSRLDPQTPYGRSKAEAESIAQRHASAGLDVRIARPFNIIGPGQYAPLLYNKVAAELVEIARGARPLRLELGNLQSFRDVIDVRDVVRGLIAIAQSGIAGEAYNICSGMATSMKTIVDELVAQSGLALTVSSAPPNVTDIAYQRGSSTRLNTVSGWAPQVPLDVSLRDTLEWWRHLAARRNTA